VPALLTEDRMRDLAALADQIPRLLRGLESGTLPTTADLGRVPTDLHALLELIDDLHQVVSGLPGAGRARDRGDAPHPQVEDPRPPEEPDPRPGTDAAPVAASPQTDGVPVDEAQPQA
jgi:hypothetical protein